MHSEKAGAHKITGEQTVHYHHKQGISYTPDHICMALPETTYKMSVESTVKTGNHHMKPHLFCLSNPPTA